LCGKSKQRSIFKLENVWYGSFQHCIQLVPQRNKINSTPITGATNYVDTGGTTSSTYTVRAVINGQEQEASKPVSVWAQNYLQIPIQPPSSAYEANDCSAADLDGDGEYEIVLKWEPNNAKDNSQSGIYR